MKRRVFLLLALSLLLLPHAAAADALAEEYGFATNSLDEIMAQFMAGYGLNEGNFSVAYYATGDHAEYRFADDTYRVAGSLFKVPLNMYYYDLERTGAIIEALSAEGYYTLKPAYYETVLKGKSVRDDESSEMLDIIFANRVYDLEYMYDWGGIVAPLYNSDGNVASLIASKYDAAVEAMNKTIEDYKKFD